MYLVSQEKMTEKNNLSDSNSTYFANQCNKMAKLKVCEINICSFISKKNSQSAFVNQPGQSSTLDIDLLFLFGLSFTLVAMLGMRDSFDPKMMLVQDERWS